MSHYIPPTHEDDLDPYEGRTALVKGEPTFAEVTAAVVRPIEYPHRNWWLFFIPALGLLGLLGISVAYLLWKGVGIWGNNIPVGWGWPIVNFVFWVGIGHAGTLISAVLFLFRQKWRTSINRASEAMTIFAVICALLFPTIHVGRVWLIYWPLPIPNQMHMWPNFRSPLLWDVFAVSTYFTVSLLFWYVGLIPDIATMRDRAKSKIGQLAYGVFALGWRGSAKHWVNYEAAYLLLAGMATPLVLSVHSIVSFDFAVSQLPGWHTTIFPPYFVAGAIFSGFGMVLTLMIPLRSWFGLTHIITIRHLESMAKIILLTGTLVGYAYGMEFFIAWYSGNPYESFVFINRAFGDYWWAYWIMVSCNVITPQFIWFKSIRRSPTALFVLSIFVNIGMWFERFVIVATSLHHDFLPSSWAYFSPTFWDVSLFLGSFGLFFTLFCLFLRFLPVIALAEVKAVMPIANPHYHPPAGGHGHLHEAAEPSEGVKVDLADETREDLPEDPDDVDTKVDPVGEVQSSAAVAAAAVSRTASGELRTDDEPAATTAKSAPVDAPAGEDKPAASDEAQADTAKAEDAPDGDEAKTTSEAEAEAPKVEAKTEAEEAEVSDAAKPEVEAKTEAEEPEVSDEAKPASEDADADKPKAGAAEASDDDNDDGGAFTFAPPPTKTEDKDG